MSTMIRQIMVLFDEYQFQGERQAHIAGHEGERPARLLEPLLPPIVYRIVEPAEQHGHRTKKTLVRLIFRLAREAAGIPTRDGGRWGLGAVHKVLTRTTYIGRHRFNTKVWKTHERTPDAEVVEISVPPIVAASDFEAVQDLLKIRGPALTALRVVSGPTPPTGIPSAKQA